MALIEVYGRSICIETIPWRNVADGYRCAVLPRGYRPLYF